MRFRKLQLVPRGVGDLRERDSAKAAERWLNGKRVLRVERVARIAAIHEAQRFSATQRIARQAAIRLNREHSGVLRKFPENIGLNSIIRPPGVEYTSDRAR